MAVFSFMALLESLIMYRLSFFQRIPLALIIWATLAIVLTLFMASVKPVAVLNSLYKVHVLLAAGLLGWWLDHVVLFPYARPAGYLKWDWRDGAAPRAPGRDVYRTEPDFGVFDGYRILFAVACMRRALVVGLIALAAALVI